MRHLLRVLDGSSERRAGRFFHFTAIVDHNVISKRGNRLRQGLVMLGPGDAGNEDNNVPFTLGRSKLLLCLCAAGKHGHCQQRSGYREAAEH